MKIPPWAVLAAALALAAFSLVPSRPAPSPTPAPTPVAPAVNGGLAAAFQAVSAADRADVASLYGSLADAVERDTATVSTTKVLAEGIGRSLDLAFAGRKLSADGSLGVAIDAHMAVALGFVDEHGNPAGIPDVVLTPALRAKAVAGLRDVARIAAGR